MKIGLIDVDGHNFPNLPLMKLSAWHKAKGDEVEWHQPLFGGHYDRVYLSKVFSFSPDYSGIIDADEIVRGGTGYAIRNVAGREIFDPAKNGELPGEVEHIYPDYSLYPQCADTAYGFLSRGCPRGCSFCHVAPKEGKRSRKVADLSEFWRGQKNVVLLDPNLLACPDWRDLLSQLEMSGANVDLCQGVDIRLMTDEKADAMARIKMSKAHFAWDRWEDKDEVQPRFLEFRKRSKINPHNLQVYVLCGDRERKVLPQDLGRIYWLRDNGYAPYVMIYDKQNLPPKHDLKRLQRWANNRRIFWKTEKFEDYQDGKI